MRNTETQITETKTAERLGREAFMRGAKRAPALDGAVLDLLAGSAAGESAPVLSAWLQGWDQANLAEDTFARIERSNEAQDAFARR